MSEYYVKYTIRDRKDNTIKIEGHGVTADKELVECIKRYEQQVMENEGAASFRTTTEKTWCTSDGEPVLTPRKFSISTVREYTK
jgi:hypothetical protein